jgi:hypothetical protein
MVVILYRDMPFFSIASPRLSAVIAFHRREILLLASLIPYICQSDAFRSQFLTTVIAILDFFLFASSVLVLDLSSDRFNLI